MNQGNVDSQLGGVAQAAPEAQDALAAVTQETFEKSPSGQDTRESGLVQEEVPGSLSQKKFAKIPGLPWNGPLPPYTYEHPLSLPECIEAEIHYKNSMLEDKERLKLVLLRQPVHSAYYRQWVNESNLIFKNLMRLRYRKQAHKGP